MQFDTLYDYKILRVREQVFDHRQYLCIYSVLAYYQT